MELITGQCHCGENEFSVTSDSEFQFLCYCKDCRTLNGGGHLCGMIFDEANLNAADQTHKYTYSGGSGHPIVMHFCPNCATHLYAYPKAHAGKVVVRTNTLDNVCFKPQQTLFTESAFDWDKTMSV